MAIYWPCPTTGRVEAGIQRSGASTHGAVQWKALDQEAARSYPMPKFPPHQDVVITRTP
jgi:hypothetical protein